MLEGQEVGIGPVTKDEAQNEKQRKKTMTNYLWGGLWNYTCSDNHSRGMISCLWTQKKKADNAWNLQTQRGQ